MLHGRGGGQRVRVGEEGVAAGRTARLVADHLHRPVGTGGGRAGGGQEADRGRAQGGGQQVGSRAAGGAVRGAGQERTTQQGEAKHTWVHGARGGHTLPPRKSQRRQPQQCRSTTSLAPRPPARPPRPPTCTWLMGPNAAKAQSSEYSSTVGARLPTYTEEEEVEAAWGEKAAWAARGEKAAWAAAASKAGRGKEGQGAARGAVERTLWQSIRGSAVPAPLQPTARPQRTH